MFEELFKQLRSRGRVCYVPCLIGLVLTAAACGRSTAPSSDPALPQHAESSSTSPVASGPAPNAPEVPLDQPLRFTHLTTGDGLSEGRVWGITQDSRGFMWFTTWEGLNRYDGYEIKVYRQERDNPNSPGGREKEGR